VSILSIPRELQEKQSLIFRSLMMASKTFRQRCFRNGLGDRLWIPHNLCSKCNEVFSNSSVLRQTLDSNETYEEFNAKFTSIPSNELRNWMKEYSRNVPSERVQHYTSLSKLLEWGVRSGCHFCSIVSAMIHRTEVLKHDNRNQDTEIWLKFQEKGSPLILKYNSPETTTWDWREFIADFKLKYTLG
jgi:hypothetical protein